MHELSLLSGVVEAILDNVDCPPGQRIITVGLKVGARSGVVLDALEAAWPLAIHDTPLDKATLEIELVEATVYCPQCKDCIPIDEYFALTCPVCNTPTADLRSGREFSVAWVDIDSV